MPDQPITLSPTAKELLERVNCEIEKKEAKRLAELEEITIGYRLGEIVEFGVELPLSIRKMIGFGQPENTHQWSLGASSSIELLLDYPFTDPVLLQLRFAPFVSPTQKSQTVTLATNSVLVASWCAYQEDDYYAIIPPMKDPISRSLNIDIYTPEASKPSDVYDSQDGRCLGVALRHLCIRNLSSRVLPSQ